MKKKWIELFRGLQEGSIPFEEEGFIIVSRFDKKSMYSVFELISFKNVKNISPTASGVIFHSDGYKTYLIYEPNNYQYRFQEPYLRDGLAQAPMRFSETKIFELARRDRIIVSKEPYLSSGSFTIERPNEGNFVYYIYGTKKQHESQLEKEENVLEFFEKILVKDFSVPKSITTEVLKVLEENLSKYKKFSID